MKIKVIEKKFKIYGQEELVASIENIDIGKVYDVYILAMVEDMSGTLYLKDGDGCAIVENYLYSGTVFIEVELVDIDSDAISDELTIISTKARKMKNVNRSFFDVAARARWSLVGDKLHLVVNEETFIL